MIRKKTLFFIIALSWSIHQPLIGMDQKTWKQKTLTFLSQPTSILTAGLVSAGIYYTCCNKSAISEAATWIKDHWNATPTFVKYPVIFMGSWWWYYNKYQKSQGHNVEYSQLLQNFFLRLRNIESILEINLNQHEGEELQPSAFQRLQLEVEKLTPKVQSLRETLELKVGQLEKIEDILGVDHTHNKKEDPQNALQFLYEEFKNIEKRVISAEEAIQDFSYPDIPLKPKTMIIKKDQ